jgi:hypothetical protein
MKTKRKLFDNYSDLLSGYYGSNKKIKINTATNFDDGKVIHHKKRRLLNNYDDLLGGYYGFNKKGKTSLAASFDNGEVIVQTPQTHGQFADQEYVVQASTLPGETEEEYVVEQALFPGESEEEYVVEYSFSNSDINGDDVLQSTIINSDDDIIQSSIINSDDHIINSLSYYSSDPTLSDRPTYPTPSEMDQGYQTSILDPFAKSASTDKEDEEDENYRPQAIGTYDIEASLFEQNSDTNQFAPSTPSPLKSPSGDPQSAKEEELINDLQAILSGKKVYDSSSGKTVDRDQLGKQQSVQQSTEKTKQADPPENPHAIFDRIKENMQYANAYNLGTIPLNTSELEKRFNDLDTISQIEKKVNPIKKTMVPSSIPNSKVSKGMDFDPTEFLHDLEEIQKGAPAESVATVTPNTSANPATTASQFDVDIHSTAYPARPTTIRPYTTKEKIQVFGHFEYEPDPSTFDGDGIKVLNGWREANIVNVSIPQLNGKKFGKQVIKNGTIAFHSLGADLLKKLWAAWEAAGLLDKIMTFEGGYAARFIRGTQNRSPRPLSNHAWGTAFDINAPWNGFGSEPALVGQTGCVRELVTIANSNGFFWGGHFSKKDGMHFELGKVS